MTCGTPTSRAVDGHRELVAVNRVDSMFAEKLYKSVYATGVDGSPQSKDFRGNTRSAEKVGEPSAPIRGSDWNDCVATFAEFFREAENHHLRSTRTIGLEHHGDSTR